jgi:hypothetical protein
MKQLQVGLGERSYPIWIGHDLLPELTPALDRAGFPRRIGMVTNPTVGMAAARSASSTSPTARSTRPSRRWRAFTIR